MERAMGIELHPKFLSLTKPRRYQSLSESIVAKCCQSETQVGLFGPSVVKDVGVRAMSLARVR
jgi:hypothetical protein